MMSEFSPMAAALLALLASPPANQARPAPEVSRDAAFPSLPAAMERASRSGRAGVAVMARLAGCSACSRMDRDILQDARVKKAMSRFEVVKIDIAEDLPAISASGERVSQRSLARAGLGMKVAPTVVFLGLDGSEIGRFPGLPASPDDFADIAEASARRGGGR